MSAAANLNRQRLLELPFRDVFPGIDDHFLAQLMPRMQSLDVPGGSVVMRQGDPSDAIYFVMSGRLRASFREKDLPDILLNEFGRGEPIGEIGVISGEPRSATVTALRDCTLLKLSAKDFSEVLSTSPEITLQLARKMVRRLTQDQRPGSAIKRIVNVCLLPLSEDMNIQSLAERLRHSLAEQLNRSLEPTDANRFRVSLIDPAKAQRALGAKMAEILPAEQEPPQRLLGWLEEQEAGHAMQVFVADDRDSPWTRMCLRQADHILLVADAQDKPDLREVEAALLGPEERQASVTQSLWLLHPNDRRVPQQTAAWLQARPHIQVTGLSHFHTRLDNASDWGRLARILSGQATGIVLAGGGARGFSHLGILKALEENGTEWDLVGGTSIGAIMAAFAAIDLPMESVLKVAAKAFATNPTGDFNFLPVMSIIKGQRLKDVVRSSLVETVGGEINIEDLWKPFFCIASNYSRQQAEVLRQGSLGDALLASAAIPVALPPILRDGDLLIDGGTFNNYPVDIMRASGAGRIVGVDLSRGMHRPLALESLPSAWQLFADRYFRTRKHRRFKGVPSMAAIVFNATAMASATHEKKMREAVDLAFSPNVARYGMLQWSAFSQIVDVGLRHAQERILETPLLNSAQWFASRHPRG